MVVALEYWSFMAAFAAADAVATSTVIAVLMALEIAVAIISILFRFRILVSPSSLSTVLFFDPHVAIFFVLRRSWC